MAKEKRIGVFDVRVVFECEPDKYERMLSWAKSRIKLACENSRYGPVLIQLYDLDGNPIGRSETDEMSEEAKGLVETVEEAEDEEPPPFPRVVGH